MSTTYPDPEQMSYAFPSNAVEQAHDELRQHPDPVEFRLNLDGLTIMYGKTACMASMERYAVFAGGLSTSQEEDTGQTTLNTDFYNGALMAVHVNVATASKHVRQIVLQQDFLTGLEQDASNDSIAENIKAHVTEWSDGEDNWHAYLEQQDEAYIRVAVKLGAKLFENKDNLEEHLTTFLTGFSFATNLVHQAAKIASDTPVGSRMTPCV